MAIESFDEAVLRKTCFLD